MLIESLPFVMLGIGLSVVVQLWVPQRVLFGMLPRTPVLRRAALSLLGVLLPVCECGNVPVARGLVNYDSAELPGLLGRSTRDLARELGASYEREVVHRDDLVVLVTGPFRPTC